MRKPRSVMSRACAPPPRRDPFLRLLHERDLLVPPELRTPAVAADLAAGKVIRMSLLFRVQHLLLRLLRPAQFGGDLVRTSDAHAGDRVAPFTLRDARVGGPRWFVHGGNRHTWNDSPLAVVHDASDTGGGDALREHGGWNEQRNEGRQYPVRHGPRAGNGHGSLPVVKASNFAGVGRRSCVAGVVALAPRVPAPAWASRPDELNSGARAQG